jgi:hypothetical protein
VVHILPAFLSAAACVCVFATASVFSSHISTSTGNEVLLDGSKCGVVYENELNGPIDMGDVNVMSWYWSSLSGTAEQYVEQCYSARPEGIGMFDCNRFVTSQLPISIQDQAPCPFDNSICRNTTSNLYLDTGYIDSHTDLGLNAPKQDRILFRSVYHCAPLHSEGYSSNVTLSGLDYTLYNYGNAVYGPKDNLDVPSYTYQARSIASQYPPILEERATSDNNFLLRLACTPHYV